MSSAAAIANHWSLEATKLRAQRAKQRQQREDAHRKRVREAQQLCVEGSFVGVGAMTLMGCMDIHPWWCRIWYMYVYIICIYAHTGTYIMFCGSGKPHDTRGIMLLCFCLNQTHVCSYSPAWQSLNVAMIEVFRALGKGMVLIARRSHESSVVCLCWTVNEIHGTLWIYGYCRSSLEMFGYWHISTGYSWGVFETWEHIHSMLLGTLSSRRWRTLLTISRSWIYFWGIPVWWSIGSTFCMDKS